MPRFSTDSVGTQNARKTAVHLRQACATFRPEGAVATIEPKDAGVEARQARHFRWFARSAGWTKVCFLAQTADLGFY